MSFFCRFCLDISLFDGKPMKDMAIQTLPKNPGKNTSVHFLVRMKNIPKKEGKGVI